MGFSLGGPIVGHALCGIRRPPALATHLEGYRLSKDGFIEVGLDGLSSVCRRY
jgi:hypothetical protein